MTEPTHAQQSEAESINHELEEILVVSTRSRRSFEDQPTRVEVLGGEEINEKANMKPGDIRMLLNESTGIHVQQTSAASFNSSIRIQGLDGKYTQLLRDGLPLYGGFAGGLSLLQVAPLDLAQVEVIKGANSTLYGGGAIAGLVNLITRTPGPQNEARLLLNATSARGTDASAFFSASNDALGATLLASYNESDGYDPADSGLSAIPRFERVTINPKIFMESEDSTLRLGLSAVKEDRMGGAMDVIKGRDTQGYVEDSDTTRLALESHFSRQLESGRELVIKGSVNSFERELAIPGFGFAGTQLSGFGEAHVRGEQGGWEWVAGANIWTEDFDHEKPSGLVDHSFSSHTVGGFAQFSRLFANGWALDSGIRLDYSADYGWFALPRFAFQYTSATGTTIRFGGGAGYKEPTLFSEEAEMLLFRGLAALQEDELEAERSVGINADINHSFDLGAEASLNLNLLLFYTQVADPLRIVDQPDGQFAFRQVNDLLDTRGVEFNAVWNWRDFKAFFGYTHADVRERRTGVGDAMALVPRDRVNNVLVYEREDDFRVGLEAYYYSRQRLPAGGWARDFWIFGLMMEKILSEDFSVFLNFENFGDARQTRWGSVFSGTLVDPQFAAIFAPLDGFVINGGIKLSL